MAERPRKRPETESPEQAFGKVLREVRTDRGLSQEQLGFESGFHRTYISLLERGLKSPSLGTIVRLARTLRIPASKLLERVESRLTGALANAHTARTERR